MITDHLFQGTGTLIKQMVHCWGLWSTKRLCVPVHARSAAVRTWRHKEHFLFVSRMSGWYKNTQEESWKKSLLLSWLTQQNVLESGTYPEVCMKEREPLVCSLTFISLPPPFCSSLKSSSILPNNPQFCFSHATVILGIFLLQSNTYFTISSQICLVFPLQKFI